MQKAKASMLLKLVSLAVVLTAVLAAGQASATPAAPATATTGTITTSSIVVNWTSGGGTGNTYLLERSTNGTTFTVVSTTIATGTLTYTATGLSVNTQYTFRVAVAEDYAATTTYTTSTAKYTYVNPAFTPVVGTPTVSTLPITINEANNPSSVTYGIWDDTTKRWLSATGAQSTTAVFQSTSTWGSATVSATGLTGNSTHAFNVIARNGDSIEAATSTTSTAKYTYTNVPSSLVATGNNSQITLTWSGDGTTYYAYNDSNGTNSGWISASTFTFTNVGCGTTHAVKVKAINAEDVESAYATAVNGVTTGCNSTGSTGGTAPAPVVVTPVVTVTTTPVVTTTVVTTPVTTPAVTETPLTPVSVVTPFSDVITPAPAKVRIYTFKKYLAVGSSGTEVKQLQTVLKKLGYFTYSKITNYFGLATKAALVKFQKAKKLKPYPGYVGPGTRVELNKSPANMK